MEIVQCEFCGEVKELGESTPFHGFYYADCLKLNMEYDREALKKMKPSRKKVVTRKELDSLDAKKDEALNKLMRGHY